jgi:hypothetical protein
MSRLQEINIWLSYQIDNQTEWATTYRGYTLVFDGFYQLSDSRIWQGKWIASPTNWAVNSHYHYVVAPPEITELEIWDLVMGARAAVIKVLADAPDGGLHDEVSNHDERG